MQRACVCPSVAARSCGQQRRPHDSRNTLDPRICITGALRKRVEKKSAGQRAARGRGRPLLLRGLFEPCELTPVAKLPSPLPLATLCLPAVCSVACSFVQPPRGISFLFLFHFLFFAPFYAGLSLWPWSNVARSAWWNLHRNAKGSPSRGQESSLDPGEIGDRNSSEGGIRCWSRRLVPRMTDR